jgi:hypothetical protein
VPGPFVIDGLRQVQQQFRWLAEEDGLLNERDPTEQPSPELDPAGWPSFFFAAVI